MDVGAGMGESSVEGEKLRGLGEWTLVETAKIVGHF